MDFGIETQDWPAARTLTLLALVSAAQSKNRFGGFHFVGTDGNHPLGGLLCQHLAGRVNRNNRECMWPDEERPVHWKTCSSW